MGTTNRGFRAPAEEKTRGVATLQQHSFLLQGGRDRERRTRTRTRTLPKDRDRDDDLSLFLNMSSNSNSNSNILLLDDADNHLDVPPGSKPGSSPIFKIVSSTRTRTRTGLDDFLLNYDTDKNDYDWLLTPPGTPLFPSLDKDSCKSPTGHTETPKSRPTALKSRLANSQDPLTRSSSISRKPTLSSGITSVVGTRRPLSSGGPGSVTSRPSTPTSRPTLPATSRPSRPSTPTSRATLPSKPVVPPRSSTPVRSSTPTSRPSAAPLSKPLSRASTPKKRPSSASGLPTSSGPPGRSSSTSKSAPLTSKTSVPPRGSSPTVKSRPWKPSEMPGFSLDAPPNLRTSLPERPTSASRGRPGAPSSRSSSIEPVPSGRPRRQSCSPARGRAPNGSAHTGISVPTLTRSRINGGDNINPVVVGNKMVERVMSARRLAPLKQDDQQSTHNCEMGKSSSSPDSSGFGRNLSKKSLDMALRHMDIRRSNPNSLRPLMTNIPASSMYSVRSGHSGKRGVNVPDSPLATSSNASSEPSVNNSFFTEGSEIDG